MDIQVSGIFGLPVLLADIWAIINVVQSRTTTDSKVLQVVPVLLLPVLGLILWLLIGPRQAKG